MSDAGQADNTRKKNPADALADLAAGMEKVVDPTRADVSPRRRVDASTALSRLAEGQTDPAVGPETAPQEPVEAEEAGWNELPTGTTPEQASQARRVRAAAFDGRQARARAHTYRRVMIPLLLVVGMLLVLVGFISGWMLLRGAEWDRRPGLSVVAVISFPLAAGLFLGAWWFRRETQASQR